MRPRPHSWEGASGSSLQREKRRWDPFLAEDRLPAPRSRSGCPAGLREARYLPPLTGPTETSGCHREGGACPAAWQGPRLPLASLGCYQGARWEGPGLCGPRADSATSQGSPSCPSSHVPSVPLLLY